MKKINCNMRDLYPDETPWSKKEREKNKKKFWITFGICIGIFAIMGLVAIIANF